MTFDSQHESCQGVEAEIPPADATTSTEFLSKVFNTLFILFVIFPCSYLFYLSFKNSLDWRFSWDLPLLLYTGFLMDHFSYIPFRDFFDMNMPGSHLTYMLIGKIFGYTDMGIRWADLSYILAIMGTTMLLTRNMGLRVVLFAPFIFAFWYLRDGPSMTLQRELLALPFIILGAALPISFQKIPLFIRAVLAGFFFGLAATIKPHLVIGLPVVVLYLAAEDNKSWFLWCRNVFYFAFWAACGLVLPLGAVAGFLLYHGALDEWLEILFNYLPLYSSITGSMVVIAPGNRIGHILSSALKMQYVYPLYPAGAIALMYGMSNPAYSAVVRKQVALLMGLTVVYWIYPMISGQFWNYHYYPFSYFMCTGMALALGPWSPRALLMQRLVPVGVTLLALTQLFKPHDGFSPVFQRGAVMQTGGRPAAIAAYLKENLKPGDKVQPLDIASGGVVHGMLLAQAELATPFIYWFHFYHHVSNPYILELRNRFLTDLNVSPPRFIVQSKVRARIMSGYDTQTNFTELDNFIKQHYVSVQERPDYVIWEHKAKAAEGGALPKVNANKGGVLPKAKAPIVRKKATTVLKK